MAEKAEKAEKTEKGESPKKSKMMLILIVLVVVLLVGGGGGAFYFMKLQKAKTATGEEAAEPTKGDVIAEEAGGHSSGPEAAKKSEAKKEEKKGEAKKEEKKGEAKKEEKKGEAKKEEKKGEGKEGEAAVTEEEAGPPPDMKLDEITVNLKGSKAGFVTIGFYIVFNEDKLDGPKRAEAAKLRIRDALFTLVSARTREELESEEGMLLLKREVTKKLNEVIGAGYVKEVGLTDKMFSGYL
jgi:flagellar basal body-associated protein FliL